MKKKPEHWVGIYVKASRSDDRLVALACSDFVAAVFAAAMPGVKRVGRLVTFSGGITVHQEPDAIRILRDIIESDLNTTEGDWRMQNAMDEGKALLRKLDSERASALLKNSGPTSGEGEVSA